MTTETPPERAAGELSEAAVSDEQLIAMPVDRPFGGLQLTCQAGLLQQLTRRVPESALECPRDVAGMFEPRIARRGVGAAGTMS